MLFFGIDIGTTNTKAVLIDREGTLLDRLTISSAFPQRDDGESAIVWHDHFTNAMDYFSSRGHLKGERIVGSVTAQGGSFVLLDTCCKPVSPVYSWTKIAGNRVVEDMVRCFGQSRYYRLTGWAPHGWLVASKLKEIITHQQMPANARYVAAAPDFIYSQITGKLITDITSAQVTGICNMEDNQWNHDILKWVGLREENVPEIATELKVLFDDIPTRWGKMSLVTGSFDQYAAMTAVGLEPDQGVMLGTGTSWVLNGKSRKPLFDEDGFNSHPGKSLFGGYFGYIVGVELIGKGFDTLLNTLQVDIRRIPDIEAGFDETHFPTQAIHVDIGRGHVDGNASPETAIRRYMEWAGASVAFRFEKLSIKDAGKIMMTGGAAKSRFWPQLIADICDIQVETVDFQELTAYGAAIHAMAAVSAIPNVKRLSSCGKSVLYTPKDNNPYRQWYLDIQKPALGQCLSA